LTQLAVIQLSSLQFESWCPHQVEARFHATGATLPIFAYQTTHGSDVPRVAFLPDASHPFSATAPIVALPVGAGLIYVGTIDNTNAHVNLVWDRARERVLYLDLAFGFDWGNERIVYESNYVLAHDSHRWILRVSDRYAVLLAVRPDGSLQIEVIADHTAPEV